MSQDAQRQALESVVNKANTAHGWARGALRAVREDESLLDLGVRHVEHIERCLRDALHALDGACFTGEALHAKIPAPPAIETEEED